MFTIYPYNRSENNLRLKNKKQRYTTAASCLPLNPRAKFEWKPEAWTRLWGRETNPLPKHTLTVYRRTTRKRTQGGQNSSRNEVVSDGEMWILLHSPRFCWLYGRGQSEREGDGWNIEWNGEQTRELVEAPHITRLRGSSSGQEHAAMRLSDRGR